MLGVRALMLLSLAALASPQTIDSLQACGKGCYDNVVNKAGEFNCAAMDFNCLCRVDSFTAGIRDCALAACGPDYMPTVTNAVAAQCATNAKPAAAPGFVPATSSSSSAPAPTTTEAPTSTSSSSSEVASTTSSSTSTTVSTSTLSSSSSSAATSSATSMVVPTRVAPSSTSATSTRAAATSSAAATPEPSGLTEAAKIGVGVGVAAAVIAILALVACVFLRKRRARQLSARTDRFKISHPMPSDEHSYTRDNNSNHDIGSGDLEMKSRRYEDMLPRQQPRQMV
ncbi:hypothetical protein N657DRAFT_580352 [Parathielavia appendiculata]|uniref:CFEM domain-containing protein n=1 Tax=Parathielavia appendiculata TaxID=2587402 RepID=A0AAN6TSY3_9PEZI|nr:hypothetical protein N657DRAFT_580352 [Parathielavia appendiculata]